MSGYLYRSKCSPTNGGGGGGGVPGAAKFKRMWFVLKDHVLYSYRAPEDTAASDTCPVLGFDLEVEAEASQKKEEDDTRRDFPH